MRNVFSFGKCNLFFVHAVFLDKNHGIRCKKGEFLRFELLTSSLKKYVFHN